ncbi:hypothetical protein BKP56_01145 [Marinilactibacillus sp. 15R]|nr:hypothetical protein BKP56_01145 [Marinilactibacillus sp. 15R]
MMNDTIGMDPTGAFQWLEATLLSSFILQILMIILAVVAIVAIIYGMLVLRQFLDIYKANSEKIHKNDDEYMDQL